MLSATHSEMHCEHKQLLNEIALWQEQLGQWRGEFRQALANLDRLKESLTCHDQALQKHAAELDRQSTQLQGHEHALAEYERGGSGADLISLVPQHKNELAEQVKRRNAHERIKRHHHSVMAQWQLLFDAITKPM